MRTNSHPTITTKADSMTTRHLATFSLIFQTSCGSFLGPRSEALTVLNVCAPRYSTTHPPARPSSPPPSCVQYNYTKWNFSLSVCLAWCIYICLCNHKAGTLTGPLSLYLPYRDHKQFDAQTTAHFVVAPLCAMLAPATTLINFAFKLILTFFARYIVYGRRRAIPCTTST